MWLLPSRVGILGADGSRLDCIFSGVVGVDGREMKPFPALWLSDMISSRSLEEGEAHDRAIFVSRTTGRGSPYRKLGRVELGR